MTNTNTTQIKLGDTMYPTNRTPFDLQFNIKPERRVAVDCSCCGRVFFTRESNLGIPALACGTDCAMNLGI